MWSKKLPLREATIFKTTYLFCTAFRESRGAVNAVLQSDRGMYVNACSLVTFSAPVPLDTVKGPAQEGKVRHTTVFEVVPGVRAHLRLFALHSQPGV